MTWWILQSLAITGALAGVVALVCRVGRVGPVARHALWIVVLAKLVTPPVVVFESPWIPAGPFDALRPATVAASPAAITPVPVGSDRMAVERPITPPAPAPLVPPTAGAVPETWWSKARDGFRSAAIVLPAAAGLLTPLLPLAVAIWMAGSVVFGGVQAIRIARMSRRVRLSNPAGPDLRRRIADAARRLGLAPIDARVVPGLAAPVVWGFGRPQLLWPADLPAELSDTCLDSLVVHELAHLKRRDHWVGWLELVAGVVWWWNPVYWMVRRRIRENAELACDAWVVRTHPEARRAYADALVLVSASPGDRHAPMGALGVGAANRLELQRRLTMVMRGHVPVRLPRTGLVCIAALAVATLPAWAQQVPPREPTPRPAPRSVPVVTEVRPEPVVTMAAPRPAPVVGTLPTPVAGAVPVPGAAARPVPGAGTVPAPGAAARPAPMVAEQALPADAQRLLDRFAQQQAEAQRDADAKIAQQRQGLIRELQALQDTYARTGRLEEAMAVRDRIRQVDRGVTPRMTPSYAPLTLSQHYAARLEVQPEFAMSRHVSRESPFPGLSGLRDHVGETVTLPVRGSTSGSVWGSGVYTDDSSLAAAAVHAGVLSPGEFGFVRVTLLPGQATYEGTSRHDVTSHPYAEWAGSFRVERASGSETLRLPGGADAERMVSLPSMRDLVGTTFTIEVTGSTTGTIWGSDEYTDDSSIATAAVHAGALRAGERGVVKITILKGRSAYASVERHGITSEPYGEWGGSFKIERASGSSER